MITNGDTQWMTAGAGILHIERPPEWLVAAGGLFHGFQLWVNLPGRRSSPRRATRTSAPARSRCCHRTMAAPGAGDRGRGRGHAGPGSTYTPMTLVHATLSPGAKLQLPWRADDNALAYVLAGRGTVRAEAGPPGWASWPCSVRAMR